MFVRKFWENLLRRDETGSRGVDLIVFVFEIPEHKLNIWWIHNKLLLN